MLSVIFRAGQITKKTFLPYQITLSIGVIVSKVFMVDLKFVTAGANQVLRKSLN